MKNFKKYALVAFAIFICLSFTSNIVLAIDVDTKNMGSKTITETNKVWTIRFKTEVDISSLSNNVQIRDITAGNAITADVSEGEDIYSAKISAPSGGYIQGHRYQLILNRGVKSKVGKALPKTTVLTFYVGANDSDTGYDASANVLVAPSIPMMKQITLTSTTLPSDTKFKIQGNNGIFNIGATVPMLAGDSVNVYFYSSDGTTQIGTAVLDLSATKNNISIKITN